MEPEQHVHLEVLAYKIFRLRIDYEDYEDNMTDKTPIKLTNLHQNLRNAETELLRVFRYKMMRSMDYIRGAVDMYIHSKWG